MPTPRPLRLRSPQQSGLVRIRPTPTTCSKSKTTDEISSFIDECGGSRDASRPPCSDGTETTWRHRLCLSCGTAGTAGYPYHDRRQLPVRYDNRRGSRTVVYRALATTARTVRNSGYSCSLYYRPSTESRRREVVFADSTSTLVPWSASEKLRSEPRMSLDVNGLSGLRPSPGTEYTIRRQLLAWQALSRCRRGFRHLRRAPQAGGALGAAGGRGGSLLRGGGAG